MIDILLLTVDKDEDREKIIYIYENYYSLMMHVVRQVIGQCDEVEDIVQEALLKIVENIDVIDLENEKRAKGLFLTIAKNKALDYFKKTERKNTSVEDVFFVPESDNSVEEAVIQKEMYVSIKEAVYSLNDTYRNVCILKYYYNYTEKEIALLLDLSPKAVNQRILRGKRHIKKYLREVKLFEFVK